MPRASKAAADSAKTASTTAEKKTAEKKTTRKPRAPKVEMFVEFNGVQSSMDTIIENVKATYAAEGGDKAIKTLKIYVKPEEHAAYYVVNGEDARKMDVYFL